MGIIKDGKYEEPTYLTKAVDGLGSPIALVILLLIGWAPFLYFNTLTGDEGGGAAFAYLMFVTVPCSLVALFLVLGHLVRSIGNLPGRFKK